MLKHKSRCVNVNHFGGGIIGGGIGGGIVVFFQRKQYLAKIASFAYTPFLKTNGRKVLTEGKILMDDTTADLQQQAIIAALSSNWEEALKINQQIVSGSPKNTEALNRLGRAYFELGQLPEAQKHFEQSLECDPYNQIAGKFLKRIEAFSKKGSKTPAERVSSARPIYNQQITTDMFLEEPGKTKVVSLLKVAEPQKLSLLSAGVIVSLVPKNRTVVATDQSGEYLGILPDDVSHHLIRLIHGGNKYQAFIKNIKINSLSILIRETYRSARFKNQPSFLDGLNTILSYSSDNIIMTDDNEEGEEPEGEEETI